MAYINLASELTGTLPGLPPDLADTYINRALSQIYSARRWSFLQTDAALVCPTMVTSGTVSITQYNATVTLDATASAALLAQTVPTAVPGLLQWQIRFGSGASIGGIYSIVAFDATNPAAILLTLDRVVQEDTDAASAYQAYRCYIVPPSDDFWRWECLVDVANAITLERNRINVKSSDFDRVDPQRTSQGLAYYLGGWGGNKIADPITGATSPNATQIAGTPIYELWPHPTSGQTFYCRYHRKGLPLSEPTDTQEPGIDDELILARALGWHAYPFAMANVGNFPTFKGANWVALIQTARTQYKEQLTDAIRNDNAQQLQDVYNRGHGLRTWYGTVPYPIDSAYLQSHLIWF